MDNTFFEIEIGDSPIVGAAIHNGHEIRKDLGGLMALNDTERLREEDPYTYGWAGVAPSTIKVNSSRFEMDLNRPPEKAIYLKPEDAWGLQVWGKELPNTIIEKSKEQYQTFYKHVKQMLKSIHDKYGYIIILDIHSYNHKREGAGGPEANPVENPEVNIGTSNMDRALWAPVVDGFIRDLQAYKYNGRHLDVRENVKFKGGYFSNWVHNEFPGTSCSLAIEFKKFFMDEWSGTLDENQHDLIYKALKSTLPGLLNSSKKIFVHA